MKGKTKSQKKSVIDEEIAANACFTVLSNEDNFTALVKQNRSLAEKVRDFFADFVEKIKNALTRLAKNNAEYRALQNDTEAKEKILAMFNKALESSQNNNTTENSSVKYSIIELDDGTSYVKANRKVITGTTVAEMRKEITNFFNEILKDGDLNVTTADGNVLTINKKTAKKARDNYITAKGKRVKLGDNEFRVKLNAESHIDELVETSFKIGNSNDFKNHSFAKNGFEYYQTFFQDFDETYYKITLSAGVNDDIATIYNVGRIEKDDLPSAKLIAVRGSKALGKSPINSISNSNKNVKFSLKEPADYSYKSLVSKPDMSVTVINDQKDYTPGKSTRENVVDEAQRSALSVGRKDSSGNVYVYVNDTDTEVMLSKRGLRHSLDRRLSIIAPVTENIGPIIKNSIRINELSPEFETIKNSCVLIGIAKNQKNEPYVVSFVVNRASNEVMSVDVLYAVNAKKEATALIEPELSSQSDVSLTASTISISDLLDYVNRYYPDILPEDVLRHYGYTARPDGVIGESALYSLKEEDNTSVFEDNEELTESAEDVQNMLRLVSAENSHLRKAFDIRTVRQVYTYKH